MRRAAARDGNHDEVVAHFRARGAKVLDLSGAANDVPDLYVEHGQRAFLVEVKDGKQKPSERRLRAGQLDLASVFRVYLVECVEDVAAVLSGERAPVAGVPLALQKKTEVRHGTFGKRGQR